MQTSFLHRLFLALFAALTLLSARADIVNGFDVLSIDYGNDGSVEVPGRLYIPANYNPANSYPLVIYYHGMGERGNDNRAQVLGNIDGLISNAASRNFFIYAPQIGTGADSWWDGFIDQTMQSVAVAMAQYNIDRKRVYATGLSLGGGGARSSINRYYDILAAAVPICGLPRELPVFLPEYPHVVGKSIWQFHAADDPQVDVAASRNYVNLVRAADGNKPPLSFRLNVDNGQPYRNHGEPYYTPQSNTTFYEENGFRYTEYGGGGHSIWGWVYGDATMYDWMLSKQLPDTTLQPGETAAFDFGTLPYTSGTDSQGRYWNSITAYVYNNYTAIAPFARTAGGRLTSVSLGLLSRFDGMFTSTLSSTLLPDAVAKDGWVTQTPATETNNKAGIFRISGLAAGVPHRVEIFGCIDDNDWGGGRQTQYKIGNETRDLNAYNNSGSSAVFASVVPDALGTFQIKVYGKPGTSTGRAVINAITVTRTGTAAPPANAAPTANAGPDQTVTLYDGVALTGTATDDGKPTGSTLTTTWSKDSGPGTVTFANASALQTTASFSQPGTYVLRLTASDSALTGFDTITVIVNEWKNIDIGTVPVAGSGTVTSGTAVVTGSGPNIWNNTDDFHFMFRPVTGDCTFIARQVSHPYLYWDTKAGIMIRGSLGRDASHMCVGMAPGGVNSKVLLHQQGATWAGAKNSVGVVPYYLKIVRSGPTLSCYIGSDPNTWELLSTYDVTLGSTVYVGFAICTAQPYSLTAVWDNISITTP